MLFFGLFVQRKGVSGLRLKLGDFAVKPLEILKQAFLVRSSLSGLYRLSQAVLLDDVVRAEAVRSINGFQSSTGCSSLYLVVFEIQEGLVPFFKFCLHNSNSASCSIRARRAGSRTTSLPCFSTASRRGPDSSFSSSFHELMSGR